MPSTLNSQAARWHFRRSRGIALVVILILLMAITTVVAFSARHAVVGESSARNQMDYEVARQAAEAALRDGESDVLLKTTDPGPDPCGRKVANRFSPIYFTPDCPNGQCSEPAGVRTWEGNSPTAEPWWPAKYGGKWGNSSTSVNFVGGVLFGKCTKAPNIVGVEYQPEYLLEYFHRDKPVVRVTARGFGVTGDETQVVLQSYVRLPLLAP
jgi:type IV pilus assembly protein PilX